MEVSIIKNIKIKHIIIALTIVLSWGFFDVSRFNAQSHIIQSITKPIIKGDEVVKSVSFVSLNNINYKQILIDLSHKHNVSFLTIQSGGENQFEIEYYYNLQNIQYIHNIDTLNEKLTLAQFNSLTSPISNLSTSEFHFSMPLHQYIYKIYPFSSINEAVIYGNYHLYGRVDDIDNFISDLESNNILVNNVPDINLPIDTVMLKEAFIGDPLRVFSFVSIIVAIYLFVFFDKRNLSIMMVHGLSKVKYAKSVASMIVKDTLLTFVISFIALLFLNKNFHASHIISIARFYFYLVGLSLLIFTIGSTLIITTFTEVKISSYVNWKSNSRSSLIFINLLKMGLVILLGFNLLPLLVNVYQTTTLINSAKKQRDLFNNIYYLEIDSEYSTTVIEKSAEIVDSLSDLSQVLYVNHHPLDDTASKNLIRANLNYLKRLNLNDSQGEKIDFNQENTIYVTKSMTENVNAYKSLPNFLCNSDENCHHLNIVTLEESSKIYPLNTNIYESDGADAITDFIISRKDQGVFVLELLYEINNEEDMNLILEKFNEHIHVDKVKLSPIFEYWDLEISYSQANLSNLLQQVMVYTISTVFISLLYYQVKFDSFKKETSIYWAYGIDRFKVFYIDTLSQILTAAIVFTIIKHLKFRYVPFLYTAIIIFIYIIIEIFALSLFRRSFIKQIYKNIKEWS